jgi:hypothetical protein
MKKQEIEKIVKNCFVSVSVKYEKSKIKKILKKKY